MIDKLARLPEVFEKHKIRYLFIGKGAARDHFTAGHGGPERRLCRRR
jgi:hypothetical protein